MKVRNLLNLIEVRLLSAKQANQQILVPDRPTLQLFLSHALWDILETEDWSFGIKFVHPAIQTQTGKREYLLPSDFGSNFLRGGQGGFGWTCRISNGSSDSDLLYESPETFFSGDRESATNSVPEKYTVVSQGGRRYLVLDPPPDSNTDAHYTIWGAYRPVWNGEILDENDDLPIPTHSALMYHTMLQVMELPEWKQLYFKALNDLYIRESSTNKPRFAPAFTDRNSYVNEYDPML